jgi:protein arginine kinase activator
LEPLLVNIHGETKHKGKRPPKYAGGTEVRTHLIRLRREMREAVTDEKYERAQEIKQEIKRVEQLPLIPSK